MQKTKYLNFRQELQASRKGLNSKVAFFVSFFTFAYAVFTYFVSSSWNVHSNILIFIGFIFLGLGFYLPKLKSFEKANALIIFCSAIVITYRCFVVGGFYSQSMMWHVLIPLTAIFFVSRTFAILMSVYCLLSLMLIFYIQFHYQGGIQLLTDPLELQLFAAIACLLIVCALAFYFDFSLIKFNEYINHQYKELGRESRFATIGKLSGGIAHEVGNPLMIVKGNTLRAKKMILRGDYEKALKILDTIENNTNRIDETISVLRTFSYNDYEVLDEKASLDKVISNSLNACADLIKEHDIFISKNMACKNLEVLGSENLLSKALSNVLENACEATFSQNEKRVNIACYDEEDKVKISISDNGPGLSPSVKEHIMEPFFSNKEEGSGYGLSISRKIIENHKGKLYLDSNHELTTFVVELFLKPKGIA